MKFLDIRPYAFAVAKVTDANKVSNFDKFKLWVLRLLLPKHIYVGIIDSKSYEKFCEWASK